MSIITLTTDFGLSDWFVGTMKGVILGIQPRANIVDLTHQIPPGDLRTGAFALAAGFRFFPRGTVHLAVVDPGVGSSRAAIAVRTNNYVFVGPDNGVLSLALSQERIRGIRRLENSRLFLAEISRTFHGRDIFAPVAAHLSKGGAFRTLGPALRDFTRLSLPVAELCRGVLLGQIVYVDRFGNAITNLHASQMAQMDPSRVAVNVGKRRSPLPLGQFYQSVPPGKPLGLVGSSGYLEIAINSGNAAKVLRLRIGDAVRVRFASAVSSIA